MIPMTEQIGTNWAWAIPALSAVAFFIVLPFRRYLPLQGAFVSIVAILLGFVLFWFVLGGLLSGGSTAYGVDWLRIGDTVIGWGVAVDEISVTMLGLVTFVALLVQVYSLGYMKHDGHYDSGLGRYYAFHSLFVAAMLALVLADNLLFLYIAWELVGLGSYLLIGFWYERRSAAEAAKKAFVTTRIGDVGLLIGIILLFRATGTFDISTIIHIAQNGGISDVTLTASTLLIFMGAMGKSAQFPFHVWLPDAMEGPTPVSALIHAATMVAAGVYLVARLMPLFELDHAVMLVVASVGLFTFIFAGTIALVVTDIKRVLAYSTVSHLGLMMLALGSGGVGVALFHLVAHGVSKAMLFLGAGSVMHAMDEETDIRKMGGLLSSMPITGWTFIIGAASLAGVVPLAGFFTKDEVLLHVLEHLPPVFIVLALAGVALSALYMARVTFVAFLGGPKSDHSEVHESPASMTVPLLLLAPFAVGVGAIAFGLWEGYHGFAAFIEGKGEFHLVLWLSAASLLLAGAGIVVCWLAYVRGSLSVEDISARFALVHRVLVSKYYVDEAYQWVIDRIALVLARFVAVFDRAVVNDVGVDGPADMVKLSGLRMRFAQTGRIYNYGMAMAAGMVVLALIWWIFV
ncbi:MAG: NADH-quinone oxidoreductase subunit L [Dehalococcoidia bacterium]|nr:NADH-quinone oxidoreductase subunit L [Dehalococcoidia bacterium]